MSSNVDKQSHQSGGIFGNVSLNWKIHNYALTVFKPDCRIFSPQFKSRGPQTTIWQIILRPYVIENGKVQFVLQLRRLDNEPTSTVVGADWKIELMATEECLLCEKTEYTSFERNSSHESVVSNDLQSIYDRLNTFKSDTLIVNFQIIVGHTTSNNSFEESPDPGLKSLSQDLFALYKSRKYSDFVIRIRDKIIPCHKAILLCRSSYFKDFFEEHQNTLDLDLSNFSCKTVNNMISYLYSGMLELVLRNPTIEMYDCAERFQIEEVKQYYCLDSLQVESKINGEKMHHEWHIYDFKTTDKGMIQSKIFKFSNLELLFNLFPNATDGKMNFVKVSVKIRSDSEKPYTLCLKLGIIKLFRKVVCMSKTAVNVESESYSEFWEWPKELVNSYVSVNGILSIDIQFQICDTETFWETSETGISLHPFSNLNEPECSYGRLSNDIRFLLASGSLSDSIFLSKCKEFKVHKCILAARSYTFQIYFSKSNTSEISRKSVKSHKANIFLDYLYCGILNNCSSSDAMELYAVADNYTLPILKVVCCRFLLSCLTVGNVSDILIFSDQEKDGVLKFSALDLISRNFRDVSAQQTFQQLKTTHSLLYSEACEFHTKNSDFTPLKTSEILP